MIPTSTPLLDTSLDGLTLHRRGKVRDVYEIGDQLLIVATDRISAFDYVLGSGIPDKGKVLTQLSAFWFERMGDLVPHHLDVDGRRRRSRRRARRTPTSLRGRSMLVRRTRAAADRVRGARLPVGIRLEGIPADRQRLRHQAARRACASPTGCPSRSSRPRRRPRAATTRTSARKRPRGGRQAAGRALKALTLEIYRRGCEHADVEGHHHRRHQVRVRPGRRRRPGHRRGADRRSADARLVALLAAGRSTSPGRASRASTSSSCATTSKRSAGTSSRRCRRCPTTSSRGRARSTSKPSACLSGRELQ